MNPRVHPTNRGYAMYGRLTPAGVFWLLYSLIAGAMYAWVIWWCLR
jgi:hypothetical protein